MKAKRITLLVSIISIIMIFVILSSTVFSLNRVEFCFLQNPLHYSGDISKEVINSADFKLGKSIFLIDKQAHMKKIEKEFPYIKVIGIETIFPNILMIQSIEREQFYAVINKAKSKIAICDGDLKILRIIDYKINVGLPVIDNQSLEFTNQEIGDFLVLNEKFQILKTLPNIYEKIGYSAGKVARFVKKISLLDNGILRIVSYNNYRIEISEPNKFLTEKVALGYKAIFGTNGVSEDFCGLITVFQKDSKLYANTIVNA